MATKLVSLRIDEELLEYLQKRADLEHRTLSNMIASILLSEMEQKQKGAEQNECR